PIPRRPALGSTGRSRSRHASPVGEARSLGGAMPRVAVATAVRKRRMPPPPVPRARIKPAPLDAEGLYSRDDLLRRFAPLVRHVVERVATTRPRSADHVYLYS